MSRTQEQELINLLTQYSKPIQPSQLDEFAVNMVSLAKNSHHNNNKIVSFNVDGINYDFQSIDGFIVGKCIHGEFVVCGGSGKLPETQWEALDLIYDQELEWK